MSNFFSKLASAVSVVTLVAASTGSSVVSAASEFSAYAQALADNGVITAQSTEAGYRLGDNVTRAELAKVVANLGGYTATECAGDVFSDVGSGLGDLCGYVEALAEAGVVSTSSATFRPTANVTRAEMVKMILGALGETASSTDAGYTDLTGLGDLAGFVNRANEIGCAADASYFRPNATASRGEAFKIASCAAQLEPVTPVDNSGSTTTTGSTTTGSTVAGALTVALSGSAVAQYVPKNASNVKVGTVTLSATTGDVTVNSVTVNRSGLGNSAGLTISVAQNGVVVSESRSVNTATQDAIVRLNNALVIKAGTSVALDVLASFDASSTENSQHQFTVKAVGTSSTVSGAPVTLGLLNTTSYEVSTVKVTSVNFNTVTSGKNDQSLGTVKFQAGAKDVTLSAFTLTDAGMDLTKVISNVKVYKNGTQVGTAAITSDRIYVTGLNTKVARQDTVEFELRGDVIYVGQGTVSVPADKATLSIAESTDVSATEDLTGYATSTSVGTAALGVNYDVLDFTALDIVWTKNTTKSVTVAPGTSNVVLFDSKLVSSASFDVTKFTVSETTNAADLTDANVYARFSSLTLTVNGVDYDLLPTYNSSTATYTANSKGSNGVYTFTSTSDKFRLDAGTAVNVKLTANLTNAVGGALRGYTFNTVINDVKNLSNSTVIVGLNKTSGNGDKVTVDAPTLKTKAATVAAPSTSKIYSNTSGLEIGRFGLEATAEEITVREITLTNSGNVAGTFTGVTDFTKLVSGTNVKLINVADGSQASATVTVNASDIKLTGMSVKVAKDTTANFKVLVDTQGDLTTNASGNIALNVDVVNATSSSASSINPAAFQTAKVYTVSVIPPTVTLVKKSANVYLVTVTNTDSDTGITLNSITAQVRPVSVANNNYSATTCLRDEGSSDKCDVATSGTGSVPGAAKTFTFAAPVSISKNSNITREIYVDSNFVSPSDLQGEVTSLTYNTSTTETYSVVAQ